MLSFAYLSIYFSVIKLYSHIFHQALTLIVCYIELLYPVPIIAIYHSLRKPSNRTSTQISTCSFCLQTNPCSSGWRWLEHELYFSIHLGMSSQLTKSYFSEGFKPPTSHGLKPVFSDPCGSISPCSPITHSPGSAWAGHPCDGGRPCYGWLNSRPSGDSNIAMENHDLNRSIT